MTTRIDSLNSGGIGAPDSGQTAPPRRPGTGTEQASSAAAPGSSESVSITDAARWLASVPPTMGPDLDDARVESLRQAIESGQYSISAERIADGLLSMEHALKGRS